ncbi:hypothetical protein JCM18750_13530 [Halostagnicola bangensis]
MCQYTTMNRRRLLSALTASGLLAATSAPVVTGRLGSNGPYSLRVETDHDNDDGLVLESHVVDDRVEQTDSGVVRFEAINRSEEPVKISSGPPAPLLDYADLDGSLLLAEDPYDGVPMPGGEIDLTGLKRPGTGAVRN